MILRYRYFYYIPAVYLLIVFVQRINDDSLFFTTWYPMLMTISFVVAGIFSMIIKTKLEKKYPKHDKNTPTHILLFFSIWSIFIYYLPIVIHSLYKETIIIEAKILQFNTHMSGGKYDYKRHYEVIIQSSNDKFNNKKIKALDNQKYHYLREGNTIQLEGTISSFMFQLENVKVI